MAGLQRNLGLSAVFTVSLGAMIGSGIFVLPGLATKLTGPGAALAYFIAGLIVIPAGLSQSEMATAMPKAGGAYLFIDRAMGPLMGTVAGFGMDFSGNYGEVGYGFSAADLDFTISGILNDSALAAELPGQEKTPNLTLVFGISKTFGLN